MMAHIVIENAQIFDGDADTLIPGHVLVEGNVIREVSEVPIAMQSARRIDVRGATLMPGLIDAHVHAYFPELDTWKVDRMPMSLIAHHARYMLEGCLKRGFTTVRDCGGGDHGLAAAIERGWVKGPRLVYCGKALSQTGGHGDKRPPFDEDLCGCGRTPYVGHRTRVVDGVDEIRIAIREEMRRGASFIKLMASGGVASPADPVHHAQFADDELRTIAQEAERHGKYATAHAHPDHAIRRCIELGVQCIEHGTLISDKTARLAAERNVPIVPTLSVVDAVMRYGAEAGIAAGSLEKMAQLAPRAFDSLSVLKNAGVQIGFGTDLIGEFHRYQCREFLIRRDAMTAFEILKSATSVNADILRVGDRLGRVRADYYADLIVVEGNPLSDISVLAQDGARLSLIMLGGRLVKRGD